MSTRRGSSRTVGVVKQCAVYVRGDFLCVFCQRRLRAPLTDGGRRTVTASIDHWDGDGRNHAPENLLPSCRTCNSARNQSHLWAYHLAIYGETERRVLARVELQLAAPLDYAAGRELAERWHPGQLEQVRANDQRYRARRAGKLPPATDFLEGFAA